MGDNRSSHNLASSDVRYVSLFYNSAVIDERGYTWISSGKFSQVLSGLALSCLVKLFWLLLDFLCAISDIIKSVERIKLYEKPPAKLHRSKTKPIKPARAIDV